MQAADWLSSRVRVVADFPRPGIRFQDLTPAMADAATFDRTVAAVCDLARPSRPDVVVGVEARGFVYGAAAARALGAGFVPVRKQGRLPASVHRRSYGLEYGRDTLEMHTDAVGPGQRVVVVDDVLATGGTACAAVGLLADAGAEVAAVVVVLELAGLCGRRRLDPVPVRAVATVGAA